MPEIFTNHNVYILGAGFSSDAGLPLIRDFLLRMADSVEWLHEVGRDEEAEAIERVFEFRLKAAGTAYRANIDVENIEELFSLAAASEGEDHTDYVTKAIAATLDFARRNAPRSEVYLNRDGPNWMPNGWRALGQDEGAQLGGYHVACPLYHLYTGLLVGRFSDPSDARDTIITFNYDTLVEDALADMDVAFHYGVSSQAADLQVGAKCVLNDQRPDATAVLKLHGSVNWARGENAGDRVRVHGSYESLITANQQVLLLPPTWRKAFGGHLMGVWRSALEAITQATRIIVLGFSMPPTDTHFKYLLAAGLRDNISLRKLVFVNPGLGEEPEKTRLRDNLFSILRPELEQRKIVVPDSRKVFEYLPRDRCKHLNRPISAHYLRIGATLNGEITHDIQRRVDYAYY